MKTLLKRMAIGFSLIAGSQAMDQQPMDVDGAKLTSFLDYFPGLKTIAIMTGVISEPVKHTRFIYYPEDIRSSIIKIAAFDQYYDLGHVRNIAFVCKDWNKLIQKKSPPTLTLCTILRNWEESFLYNIVLNAKLTYQRNDGRLVVLPFVDLSNPFEGTFDLSDCDDAGNHLSISVGPRRGYNHANADKIEIWFCLRDMIMKHLNGNTKNYARYFPEWKTNAPIGIFWNLGGNTAIDLSPDYLTHVSLNSICNDKLLKLWINARKHQSWLEEASLEIKAPLKNFMIILNKN